MNLTLALGLVAGMLGVTTDSLPETETQRLMQSVDFRGTVSRVLYFGPETELISRSQLDVPDSTLADFQEVFASAPYFGAFAISKSGGYGYSVGVNSAEAARAIAMAECLNANSSCLIFAELHPVGYQGVGPGEIVLTTEVADLFFNPGKRPPYIAMAFSHDGAYSLNWGYESPAAAQAAALADCETYRINHLANLEDMPCLVLPLR
ncbi:hypothetical protein EU803_10965 [Loktanella sp. IMCC34160]|uniref:hypothetical protein n=1 Tax=Loktanella sp. IMCC34160 TaxID=2510646 RepID=UPI00101DF9D1|nr:hypothetical protein [Loktanella sp. IMCC34160]RYG91595.1 hypothetical protein EU803_10965 [Loktanella sp. IMCC34160]